MVTLYPFNPLGDPPRSSRDRWSNVLYRSSTVSLLSVAKTMRSPIDLLIPSISKFFQQWGSVAAKRAQKELAMVTVDNFHHYS